MKGVDMGDGLILDKCPDCGGTKILHGPEGGGCINVCCGNSDCRSAFNDMGPFGLERIPNCSFRSAFPGNHVESERYKPEQWSIEEIAALME